jgi:hypothetical protein
MAEQAKHTPGPWGVFFDEDANQFQVFQNEGRGYGRMLVRVVGVHGMFKANAQLIAAAPELLAALEGLILEPYGCTLCDSGEARNPEKGHQPDCPYEAARAAVAKARGDK